MEQEDYRDGPSEGDGDGDGDRNRDRDGGEEEEEGRDFDGIGRLDRESRLPNLKLVAIPEFPISPLYKKIPHASFRSFWKEGRKALKNLKIIKNGEVGLHLLKAREIREFKLPRLIMFEQAYLNLFPVCF